jgi:hypothetical protein
MEGKVPVISTAGRIERYGFWRLEIFGSGNAKTPVVLYDPDEGPEEYRWIGETVNWISLYLSKRHHKKSILVDTRGHYGLGIQLFVDGCQLKYLVENRDGRGEGGCHSQFSMDEARILASASVTDLRLLDKNGREDHERKPLPFSNVGLSEALAGIELVDRPIPYVIRFSWEEGRPITEYMEPTARAARMLAGALTRDGIRDMTIIAPDGREVGLSELLDAELSEKDQA